MRFAAIDIGSNSIRLLVAEIPDNQGWAGTVETVARAGEVCRLGRGLLGGGNIAEELVERAADITHEFARRARSLGAVNVIAGATAALRSAGNGREVAERLGTRAGIPVRILSGEDEARLTASSPRALVTERPSPLPRDRTALERGERQRHFLTILSHSATK